MTPEQRKEIEERVAAATAGPWRLNLPEGTAPQGYKFVGISPPNSEPNGCFKIADAYGPAMHGNADFIAHARTDIPALLSALDAAEARAVAAEDRGRELEEALKLSCTLACRGVDRIDEENKTAGPRLARVHRQRLTTMCNQIKKHVDQALKAQGSGE